MGRTSKITMLAFGAFIGIFIILSVVRNSKPPEDVTFGTLCRQHDGDIAIQGYLSLNRLTPCQGAPSYCDVGLFPVVPEPGSSSPILVTIQEVTPGNKNNGIERVFDGYKPTDLRIHTDDGQVLSYQDRIKVVGFITAFGKNACTISAKKLLKADKDGLLGMIGRPHLSPVSILIRLKTS